MRFFLIFTQIILQHLNLANVRRMDIRVKGNAILMYSGRQHVRQKILSQDSAVIKRLYL